MASLIDYMNTMEYKTRDNNKVHVDKYYVTISKVIYYIIVSYKEKSCSILPYNWIFNTRAVQYILLIIYHCSLLPW